MKQLQKEFSDQVLRLKGERIHRVYYEHDVEGYFNFRVIGEKRFEYLPLSNLLIETLSSHTFTFFDSDKFIPSFSFYTLDLNIGYGVFNSKKYKDQSEYFLWSSYLNSEIVDVIVHWDIVEVYTGKTMDFDYPKAVELCFDDNLSLFIVSSDIDYLKKDKYVFRYPDEAIVVFFEKVNYKNFIK